MKYWIIPVIIAVFILVASPKILKAPPFIQGYVYDASDSTAIDSATVVGVCIDAVGRFSTFTDANGYYVVNDSTLPQGDWRVTASHWAYNSQSKTEWLPCTRYTNFYLQPRP